MGHGETKMRLQEARRLEASRPNSHLRPARSNPCSPRPHPSLMRHKPSLPRPSQASQGSIKPLKAQSSLPRLNQASQGYIKPPKAQSSLPRLNHAYQGSIKSTKAPAELLRGFIWTSTLSGPHLSVLRPHLSILRNERSLPNFMVECSDHFEILFRRFQEFPR